MTSITGSSNTGAGYSLVVNNSDSSAVFGISHGGNVDIDGDVDIEGGYRIDGAQVLYTDGTMSNTILVGRDAGVNIDTTTAGNGDGNTIVGSLAAPTLTTGTNNIVIGNGVDVPLATTSNYLNIGDAITGNLTSNDITIAGDLTVTGGNIDVNGSSDGQILIDTGIAGFTPTTVGGDATINTSGNLDLTTAAVQENEIDASSFGSGTGATCLKTDGSSIFTEACSGGGGGDGVGGDGLPEVLANDPSANNIAITDLANPTNNKTRQQNSTSTTPSAPSTPTEFRTLTTIHLLM